MEDPYNGADIKECLDDYLSMVGGDAERTAQEEVYVEQQWLP
jgi:hypothetical protein